MGSSKEAWPFSFVVHGRLSLLLSDEQRMHQLTLSGAVMPRQPRAVFPVVPPGVTPTCMTNPRTLTHTLAQMTRTGNLDLLRLGAGDASA